MWGLHMYILVRGCHWQLSLVPFTQWIPNGGHIGLCTGEWLCVLGLGASLLGLAGSLLGDSV